MGQHVGNSQDSFSTVEDNSAICTQGCVNDSDPQKSCNIAAVCDAPLFAHAQEILQVLSEDDASDDVDTYRARNVILFILDFNRLRIRHPIDIITIINSMYVF